VRIYTQGGTGHKDVGLYLSDEEGLALLKALQSWAEDEAAGVSPPGDWQTEIVDGEWRLFISVDSDTPPNFVKSS